MKARLGVILMAFAALAWMGNSYLSTRYNVFGPQLSNFTWAASYDGSAGAGTTMTMLDSNGNTHWSNEVNIMVTGDTLFVDLLTHGIEQDSIPLYPIEANGPTYRFPSSVRAIRLHRPYSQADSLAVGVTWRFDAEQ